MTNSKAPFTTIAARKGTLPAPRFCGLQNMLIDLRTITPCEEDKYTHTNFLGALAKHGIIYLGQLVNLTEEEFKATANVGQKTCEYAINLMKNNWECCFRPENTYAIPFQQSFKSNIGVSNAWRDATVYKNDLLKTLHNEVADHYRLPHAPANQPQTPKIVRKQKLHDQRPQII